MIFTRPSILQLKKNHWSTSNRKKSSRVNATLKQLFSTRKITGWLSPILSLRYFLSFAKSAGEIKEAENTKQRPVRNSWQTNLQMFGKETYVLKFLISINLTPPKTTKPIINCQQKNDTFLCFFRRTFCCAPLRVTLNPSTTRPPFLGRHPLTLMCMMIAIAAIHLLFPCRWVNMTSYSGWWLNQPMWNVCSSNWIIFPDKDGHEKYLKPPPRFISITFSYTPMTVQNIHHHSRWSWCTYLLNFPFFGRRFSVSHVWFKTTGRKVKS